MLRSDQFLADIKGEWNSIQNDKNLLFYGKII